MTRGEKMPLALRTIFVRQPLDELAYPSANSWEMGCQRTRPQDTAGRDVRDTRGEGAIAGKVRTRREDLSALDELGL